MMIISSLLITVICTCWLAWFNASLERSSWRGGFFTFLRVVMTSYIAYILFGFDLMYCQEGYTPLGTVKSLLIPEGEGQMEGLEFTLMMPDLFLQAGYAVSGCLFLTFLLFKNLSRGALVIITFLFSGVIYPLMGSLSWGNQFLEGYGFSDFSGGIILNTLVAGIGAGFFKFTSGVRNTLFTGHDISKVLRLYVIYTVVLLTIVIGASLFVGSEQGAFYENPLFITGVNLGLSYLLVRLFKLPLLGLLLIMWAGGTFSSVIQNISPVLSQYLFTLLVSVGVAALLARFRERSLEELVILVTLVGALVGCLYAFTIGEAQVLSQLLGFLIYLLAGVLVGAIIGFLVKKST